MRVNGNEYELHPTVRDPTMGKFTLKGRELEYTAKGRKWGFKEGEDHISLVTIDVNTKLDTACDVEIDTSAITGKNLELILETIDFKDLEGIKGRSNFGAFKYIDLMREGIKQSFVGDGLDFEKAREVLRNERWKISGQRSIIVALDNPIGQYEAVKIKGRVYVPLIQDKHGVRVSDFCPVVMQPYGGFGFSNPPKVFNKLGDLVKGGNLDMGKSRPHGGMLGSKAIQEFVITMQMHEAGLPVCLPLGYGVHTSDDYKPTSAIRERPGFVLLGIHDRMDYRLMDTIYHSRNRKDFTDYVDMLFQEWGKALRKMNDLGFSWGFPHIENVSYDDDKGILLHDMDNAQKLEGLTRTQEAMYRLSEIYTAMHLTQSLKHSPEETEEHATYEGAEYGSSGIVLRLFAMANVSRILQEKRTRDPVSSFTIGYFGKEINFDYEAFEHGFMNVHKFKGKDRDKKSIDGMKNPRESPLYKATMELVKS